VLIITLGMFLGGVSFPRHWFSVLSGAVLVPRWRRRWPDKAVACPEVTGVLPCLGWKARALVMAS